MKKILFVMLAMLTAQNAMAETVVVVNDFGRVVSTQQVMTTLPPPTQITVVREVPQVTNYYDSFSTGTAFAAGITTAVVGALLFDGIHHKKHHAVSASKHHVGSVTPVSHNLKHMPKGGKKH